MSEIDLIPDVIECPECTRLALFVSSGIELMPDGNEELTVCWHCPLCDTVSCRTYQVIEGYLVNEEQS